MQPAQHPDGMWTYPNSKEVLKMVGLKTIDHYTGVCIVTIARFIVDQWTPIYTLFGKREKERIGALHLLVGAAAKFGQPGDTAGLQQRWGGQYLILLGAICWFEQLVWVVLGALACRLIPHGGKAPALWRPSLHTHPFTPVVKLDIIPAKLDTCFISHTRYIFG